MGVADSYGRSERIASTTATHAQSQVSLAAPDVSLSYYIMTIIVSFSAAVTTATSLTITDGTTTTTIAQIPAGAAAAPDNQITIPFALPHKIGKGNLFSAQVADAGAAVAVTVAVQYFIGE